MHEFINKRLNSLALNFFELDCERENLLFRLDQLNERIMDIKSSIHFSTGYPEGRQLFELNELILDVSHNDISVYTNDQFEKVYPDVNIEDIQ